MDTEWLEADGLGGYASGTAHTIRTRRYHGLLLTATTPPTGRMMLVNGVEAWVKTPSGLYALTTHRYAPGILHPDGMDRIASFEPDPWPTWTYEIADGTRFQIRHELFVPKGLPAVVLSWRIIGEPADVSLLVRPLLSGRTDHALQVENSAFRFEATVQGDHVTWAPYEGVPAITAITNGEWEAAPDWYRQFQYDDDRDRGLDCTEDLGSPGVFRWHLSEYDALLVLTTGGTDVAPEAIDKLRRSEKRRRAAFGSPVARLGDQFIVQRGHGRSVIAGYPWFTDWGRDTFISLRGLCLATERLSDALNILVQWADSVSEGMVPNRFPDRGEEPEYNSVDASLWFVIAAHETLQAFKANSKRIAKADIALLQRAILQILDGYARGTRYGVRTDRDGLLAAGVPGVALTWMDARIDGKPVTPRIGKPVEIQALWINALRIGAELDPRWKPTFEAATESFEQRFWNETAGHLFDVVDVDHAPGTADPTLRPNQLFAFGGLPLPLVEGKRARAVLDLIETRLLTPVGLRTLDPAAPGYVSHYVGAPAERDAAYHQGTAWPWLMGPFIEAWLRVRGSTARARAEARRRFLPALEISAEIADAEPPHTLRGCPFQAWSVGERLRMEALLG